MSTLRRYLLPFVAAAAFLITGTSVTRAGDAAAPQTAPALASTLSALRQDGTAYVRLRMDIGGDTLQIQIKQRQVKGTSEVVYQILFPKERKGESVLVRRIGGKTTGSVFLPPDTLRPIEDLKAPLFGSDLSYDDLVENFFAWDQQTLAGTDTIDGTPCQILESRPGKSDRSIYTSVKSWIDPRRMVPMRVEKYTGSGQLVRRIDTTKVVNDAGHAIPANLAIHGPKGSTTQLDGSRIKHDVPYTDHDFTPEALKDLTVPKGD